MKLLDKEVLYVDNHLLVLNKPAGMLTQPNESDDPSLEEWGKRWLKNQYQKPGNVFLHAVHRLDRPVSGIVLFARTSKALSRLNSCLRGEGFQKEYIALVEGHLEHNEGVLEHYLQHDSFVSRVVSSTDVGAKKCLLKYSILRRLKRYTLLKISLITGRYHQIRAQLAAIGHPILGDCRYGSTHVSTHLFLHHAAFKFPHPITQEQKLYEVPLPESWDLLN